MEATPSQRLSLRLERLEKDLHLLSGMQTLIMTDSGPRTVIPSDITVDYPERDGDVKSNDTKNVRKNNNSLSVLVSDRPLKTRSSQPIKCKENNAVKSRQQRHDQSPNDTQAEAQTGVTKSTSTDGLEDKSHLKLLEALKTERERRNDIEDAATRVQIKLQQTEDELKKERETKQMLLVGTLQLKNQISGQEAHLNERVVAFKQAQDELNNLQLRLSNMTSENVSNAKHFKELICSLKADRKVLQAENKKIVAEKAIVENQLDESLKHNAINEQTIQGQEQKLITQLNQMASKYAHLQKDHEHVSKDLSSTLEKLNHSDKELQDTQMKLHKLQAESNKELVLKDCILDKIKSEMLQQKEKFEFQIQTSQKVISETKSLILRIKQERDDLRKVLAKCKQENRLQQQNTTEIIQNYHKLQQDYEKFKKRIKYELTGSEKHITMLKTENNSLTSQVKKLENEKELQLKLTISGENELLKQKTAFEEKAKQLENENENLLLEQTRCTENFRVLQKISEDQSKTIQILRNERDEQRKLKFSLETEIREKEAKEASLVRKLDQEQRAVLRLEESIENYQKKISAWEEELREHNCEEFVETAFQRKISEVETEAKERFQQWEESLKAATTERDVALRQARQCKRLAEETKTKSESRLFEITSKAKQDLQRLKVDTERSLNYKDMKIQELETSLEQQRLQAQQMQKCLYSKIQQLQCALNVCVTSSAGPTVGSSGIGPNIFSNFI